MKRFTCILFLILVPAVFAKPREWQTATILKAVSNGSETEAVAVPLPGGGAVGESTTTSGKHMRGVYWLKTDKFTYVIPNLREGEHGWHSVVAVPHSRRTNQNLYRFRENYASDRRRGKRSQGSYNSTNGE